MWMRMHGKIYSALLVCAWGNSCANCHPINLIKYYIRVYFLFIFQTITVSSRIFMRNIVIGNIIFTNHWQKEQQQHPAAVAAAPNKNWCTPLNLCDIRYHAVQSLPIGISNFSKTIENIKSLYHHSIWRSFGLFEFLWCFIEQSVFHCWDSNANAMNASPFVYSGE